MSKLDELKKEYQEAFGVTDESWFSKERDTQKIYAQRSFARKARTMGFTWREIGKACGKSDHTAMIKLCQQAGWREKNIKANRRKK